MRVGSHPSPGRPNSGACLAGSAECSPDADCLNALGVFREKASNCLFRPDGKAILVFREKTADVTLASARECGTATAVAAGSGTMPSICISSSSEYAWVSPPGQA